MEDAGPFLLPDSLVYQIFLNLGPVDLLSAGLVCRRWYQVSRDDFLWKELFYRHYQVQPHIHRYPGKVYGSLIYMWGNHGGYFPLLV